MKDKYIYIYIKDSNKQRKKQTPNTNQSKKAPRYSVCQQAASGILQCSVAPSHEGQLYRQDAVGLTLAILYFQPTATEPQ